MEIKREIIQKVIALFRCTGFCYFIYINTLSTLNDMHTPRY
jgi:hypothetical protein